MAGPKLLLGTVDDIVVADPNERFIRDPEQIERLGEALYGLVEQDDHKKIVLDLSKVQLFSSAALGVMMALRRKADQHQTRVVIAGLGPELREIFKLMKLEKLFDFYPDQPKAVASFRK